MKIVKERYSLKCYRESAYKALEGLFANEL